MPRLTCRLGTLDACLRHDHETVRLWRSARPFPTAEATAMPHPSPAPANHAGGFLLALTLLAGCGPNTVLVPAMQYGMNVGDLALSNLLDATDDDQPIDPEAIRAKARAVCVEEQLTEADCTRLMAQVEKNIDLVYRLQGLDAMPRPADSSSCSRRSTRWAPSPASPMALRARPARSVRPVLRPRCDASVFSICSPSRATNPPEEVAMRPAPDDEFKLRFPVAKDRTLRRIAIMRISLVAFLPVSFFAGGFSFQMSRAHDPRWPDHYGEMDGNSPFFWIGALFAILLLIAILSLIVTNIIEGIVFTRRYGWRAVSDPIEAQRIAMREALYDVATGSAQAMPDHDGDRIIVVPTRRLRPVGARLELTAERDKAQGSRGAI